MKVPCGRFKLSKQDSYTGEFKQVNSGYLVSKLKVGESVTVGSISSRDFYTTTKLKEILKTSTMKSDDGSDLFTVKFKTESGSIYELKQFD